MRKLLDKSRAIDAASNLRLVTMIQNHDEPYTEQEEEILEDGKKMLAVFGAQTGKKLTMPLPAVKAKLAFKAGDSRAFGIVTTTVRASPDQVLAFMWGFDKRFRASTDVLEKNLDEEPSAHNKLLFSKRKAFARQFDSRSFLARFVWRALDGGGFVLVSSPEETERRPPEEGVVRATYTSVLKIKPLGSVSKLEYMVRTDAGGSLPAWVMNLVMGKTLARVIQTQEFFQSGRGLAEWSEEDGRCTGEFCLMKTKEEKHHGAGATEVEARVGAMMEAHKGLRELGEEWEWFKVLLAKLVVNKLRPAGVSKVKLCNVSIKEAGVIGGGLAICIASNLTAIAAVDDWLLRYPAMGELDRK
jgi:hypothetical protein